MAVAGWTTRDGYVRFLQTQLAARLPIEDWASVNCEAALRPPPHSYLMQEDLAELSAKPAAPVSEFALAEGASQLGAVWALAGSSLGNAAILRDVQMAAGDNSWPVRFLSDTAMHTFWKGLLPQLEAQASADAIDAACEGALAVFDHFLKAVRSLQMREAA